MNYATQALAKYRKRRAKSQLKAHFRGSIEKGLIGKDDRPTLENWQPLVKMDLTREKEKKAMMLATDAHPMEECSIWRNDEWSAVLTSNAVLYHITIRHTSGKPVQDWAAFQAIKNQLVGNDQEMCELYPAESRMVNAEHLYHLWGFRGMPFPFGWGATKDSLIQYLEACKELTSIRHVA